MDLPAEALFPAPWNLLEMPPPLPGSASSRASSTTVSSPSLSTALCLVNQWFSRDKFGPLVPHSDTHQGPRQTTPSSWCHLSGIIWAAQAKQDKEEGKEGKEVGVMWDFNICHVDISQVEASHSTSGQEYCVLLKSNSRCSQDLFFIILFLSFFSSLRSLLGTLDSLNQGRQAFNSLERNKRLNGDM